jgi:hypothetical protein
LFFPCHHTRASFKFNCSRASVYGSGFGFSFIYAEGELIKISQSWSFAFSFGEQFAEKHGELQLGFGFAFGSRKTSLATYSERLFVFGSA